MKKSVHEAVDAHEIVSMSSGAFLCHQVHSATIDVKRALVEGWGHVGERPQRIVEKYELNTIYYDIRRILISEVESDLRTASDLSSEQPEGKSHSTPVFSSTSPHFQQKKVYIHPSISNGAFWRQVQHLRKVDGGLFLGCSQVAGGDQHRAGASIQVMESLL